MSLGSIHIESLKDKSGQMTVMLTFLLFATILILGITLNISELFIWHGHLQTSLDCAVYSGAVKQARGLNEIAKKNSAVKENWDVLRAKWNGSRIFSSKSEGLRNADRDKSLFEQYNERETREQQRLNSETPSSAYWKAKEIASLNESTAEFEAYGGANGRLTQLTGVVLPPVAMKFRFIQYYWVSSLLGPPVRRSRIVSASGASVSARIVQKATKDNTYFCGKLTKPSQEYVFRFKDKDGRDLLDTVFRNMRTYATAIPYGGKLWDRDLSVGIAQYDVKLVRTGAVWPIPSRSFIKDNWGYDW